MPQVTLEQWKTLLAVVDNGSYAAAAEALQKSQSSISYAIQKLEEQLGLQVFRVVGRKAELTPAGKALLRRAEVLLEEARQMEALAQQFTEGWEPEIRIAMDTLFPDWVMIEAIAEFSTQRPLTRITLLETVLSGTEEALLKKEADIVIGARTPPGFLGNPLLNIEFLAVAAPSHPLHELNRPLEYQDLQLHRQLVVRDSGSRDIDAGWLGADQRLTLSSIGTSIAAACKGLGYAWYPELKVRDKINSNLLCPLNMSTGSKRNVQLSMIYTDGNFAGPAVRLFGEILSNKVNTLEMT